MTAPVRTSGAVPEPPRQRRGRRWVRRILVGLAVLVVVLLAGTAVVVKLQPVAAPLALPGTAEAPAGPVAGTWAVGPRSIAGFRVRQTVLGLTSDVVGRTAGVTGTVTLTADRVTGADLDVDLRALTSGGKPAPQFGRGLDVAVHPTATVRLVRPIALSPGFTAGEVLAVTGAGELTLHGVTRPVTLPLSARRAGDEITVTGRIPVAFEDFRLARPGGVPVLGALDDHGVAEFLLVLHRA